MLPNSFQLTSTPSQQNNDPLTIDQSETLGSDISEIDVSNFKAKVLEQGFIVHDVVGDGNCLFRAVADQIEGDEHQHPKYRKIAVDHISRSKAHFAAFMDETENINTYISKMKQDGMWGGYLELVALSEALGVDFCLHFIDGEPYTISSELTTDDNRKPYHLVYYTDVHYSSLRRIDDQKFYGYAPRIINYDTDEISHEKLEVWKRRKRDFLKRIVRKVFHHRTSLGIQNL